MNQPDKLFRDKLHNYQKPASPEAWRRISQRVNGAGDRTLWLKIAAGVLVLALAGVFLFTSASENSEKLIASIPDSGEKEKVTIADLPNEANIAKENTDNQNRPDSLRQDARAILKAEKKPDRPSRLTSPIPSDELKTAVKEPSPDLQSIEASHDAIAQTEVLNESTEKQSTASSVTIIFTAKEVNEKYFTKKEAVDATPEEKESSTLKKVLEKAYDLTHNQDPIGDIRQKKNEILAMNFKNDKQRNEND